MQRQAAGELVPFDPEIERTARARRRAAAALAAMGDNIDPNIGEAGVPGVGQHQPGDEQEAARPRPRTMRDFTTPTAGSVYPGFGPNIMNNQFEIKPAILNIIRNNAQFSGMASEDPHLHLAEFSDICGTFRYAGIADDTVKLRLFPFSLRDKAKVWLHSIPPGTAATWDALASKFLAKFYPVDKIVSLRREIATFRQLDQETLAEAWERLSELLRRCPGHELQPWNVVELFYFGIEPNYRAMIDAAAGGTLMNHTPEEALRILRDTASHSTFWTAGRNAPRSGRGLFMVDSLPSPSPPAAIITCEGCGGGGHHAYECSGNQAAGDFAHLTLNESVNYIGNQPKGAPFNNAYNPGARSHPNFSWNPNTPGQRWLPGQHQNDAYASGSQPRPPHPDYNQAPPTQKKSNLEEMMEKFVLAANSNMANQTASMRNLETHLGQLAQALAERSQGSLPSNTEKNPIDQGKSLGDVVDANPSELVISCSINKVETKALCDSGSSRNVIALQDVAKLQLEINTEERKSLILANGTIIRSEGEVRNVEVIVEGTTVVADFQVLGPQENQSIPILGVPFLKESGATLDFATGCVLLPNKVPQPSRLETTADTSIPPPLVISDELLSCAGKIHVQETSEGGMEELKSDEEKEIDFRKEFDSETEEDCNSGNVDVDLVKNVYLSSCDESCNKLLKRSVSWADPVVTVTPEVTPPISKEEKAENSQRWQSPTVTKLKREKLLRDARDAALRCKVAEVRGAMGNTRAGPKAFTSRLYATEDAHHKSAFS